MSFEAKQKRPLLGSWRQNLNKKDFFELLKAKATSDGHFETKSEKSDTKSE